MTTKQRAAQPQPHHETRRRSPVCIATARSGQRCKAAPIRGTKHCSLHTEGVASRLGQKGGRRLSIYDPDELTHFESPKTVAEVTAVLGQLAVETHQGKIDPRVAGTLTGTLSTLLAALEVKEQGAILRELERRMGVQDAMAKLRDEVTGRYVTAEKDEPEPEEHIQ